MVIYSERELENSEAKEMEDDPDKKMDLEWRSFTS